MSGEICLALITSLLLFYNFNHLVTNKVTKSSTKIIYFFKKVVMHNSLIKVMCT
jgi:hypothetical protein